MKTVIICAGGPEEELIPLASFADEGVQFIGADRGTVHLLKAGIIPAAAIGDFDSVSTEEMKAIEDAGCRIERWPAEKDETDTELALEAALSLAPDRVIITGVTGGRLDHMYSALQLLGRYTLRYRGTEWVLANRQNEMRVLPPGVTRVERSGAFPYLSLFPMTMTAEGLSLAGVKYEVEEETIHFGDTRFTSNEITAPFCTITIRTGICLMVRSSDS
ncbi:thiamine pyrophosphokinase [Sporosarcina sp. NCCP-2716]|uniref:thiamine diphosphokinase n=1 Tax=Sporosarcina sp. NCCP-2716 TaxID=2943679 RepID=UPI00203FBFB2|nr:thiamine diphosphokinase [Sporosarcina sp. NCCP-2716]GKV67755.1 thiamine pyrophosphokinase [Sporosarcina sp. NCCP-2716]